MTDFAIPFIRVVERLSKWGITMQETDAPGFVRDIEVRLEPQMHIVKIDHATLARVGQRDGPGGIARYMFEEVGLTIAQGAFRLALAGVVSQISDDPESFDLDAYLDVLAITYKAERDAMEKDRDSWKALADRRKIEIEALERAIARRSE